MHGWREKERRILTVPMHDNGGCSGLDLFYLLYLHWSSALANVVYWMIATQQVRCRLREAQLFVWGLQHSRANNLLL